jgi:SAM-dependent methyltransferase
MYGFFRPLLKGVLMKREFGSPFDYYNFFAERYDEKRRICNGNNGIILRMVNENLPRLPCGKLLDIGCGTGLVSLPFFKGGWKIFGVDGATEMLKVFIQKGFAEFCQQVDVEKGALPFPDNFFDMAISNGVFCHLSNLNKVIGETGRVLKKGGIFCFTVENINHTNPFVIIRSRMNIYRHDLETMQRVLGEAGFDQPMFKNYYDHQMPFDCSEIIFTAMLCRKE